jgi:hypothetical protein
MGKSTKDSFWMINGKGRELSPGPMAEST